MIDGNRVCVVMPAYNAAATLEQTYRAIPDGVADRVIVVDDGSHDDTVGIARSLGLETHVHAQNMGYGGNQKSCYRAALRGDEEIVVMLHPDYQYSPALLPAIASMVASRCHAPSAATNRSTVPGRSPSQRSKASPRP